MFPHSFVREHVLAHTRPGDTVFDPFSGRGTTLLESLLLDRYALASDVNPVAACITGAKAYVPPFDAIITRLCELEVAFQETAISPLDEERHSLPLFFARAFHYRTLREILFLRRRLDWRRDATDRFIAALALGSLHGEMDRSHSYFSNQMPRTISTKPDYSVRFWKERGLKAARRPVFNILRNRAVFRLEQGSPSRFGIALQGDVRRATWMFGCHTRKVRAVITSPPYLDVTNFEEDQWLRLWFLGGAPKPTYGQVSKDDRHSKPEIYWQFLAEAWQGIADLVADEGVIVCRIGGKKQAPESLARGMVATIRSAFPCAELVQGPLVSAPLLRQTDNFRPGTKGLAVEADFVFCVGKH